MLLALMSMMALAVFAPAAMADAVVGDGDDYDSDTAATAAAAQYGDNGVYGDQYGDDLNEDGIDDGIDDDNGAALPSTGGPALLPLVGLAALGIGALSLVSARVRRNS